MAGQPKTPIAHLEVQPARIDWMPQVDYQRLILTVAGPDGIYIRQEIEAGQAPSFSLFQPNGEQLTDGIYTYELRVVPRVAAEIRNPIAEDVRRGAKPPERPLVQSGYFSVIKGSFEGQGKEEPLGERSSAKKPSRLTPTSAEDLPIDDDLIVMGNTCLGVDCVDGETFEGSSSPLKLKQNNIRIAFEDTSTATGFPTNDWGVVINDSQNGGANRFSIEDFDGITTPFTISGGAPDNSLFVAASGNLGFGTSTPALRLDVKANATGQATERLQNSSATGYSGTEYLDNAGNVDLFFGVDNAASTTRLNSVNSNPIVILTNSSERIRVTSGGDVGIGTASPTQKLDVESGRIAIGDHTIGERTLNGGNPVDLEASGLRNIIANVDSNNDSTNASFVVVRNSDATQVIFVAREDNLVGINKATPGFPLDVGTDSTNGNGAHVTAAGVWTNGSSRTNKTNIQALAAAEALTALGGLKPVRYTGKDSPDNEEYVGFIAEDVPDLVAQNDRKSLSPMDIVAVLTKVAQEREKTISELAARLAVVEAALEAATLKP